MEIRKSQEIVKRARPCDCGCKGRDPWHKAKFIRAVTDIKLTPGESCVTTVVDMQQQIFESGLARIPGFPRPVRVVRVILLPETMARPTSWWEIDDEDACNARNGK